MLMRLQAPAAPAADGLLLGGSDGDAARDLVRSAPLSPAGPIDAESLRSLPSPPTVGLPAVAQVLWFSLRQSGFVFRQQARFGDVWSARGYVRGGPVVVSHPDHLRSLFTA